MCKKCFEMCNTYLQYEINNISDGSIKNISYVMGQVMVTLVVMMVVVVVMMVMMTVFDGSVKKNAETLLVTHYLVRSLVKECMCISGMENKGQIHEIKTCNKSFETANTRHLEMTVTNHNGMCEAISWRSNLENAFYILVQNLLSYLIHFDNIKIKIYRNMILPIMYGCETVCHSRERG